MARSALSAAGIESIIQGSEGGQLLGTLAPSRFPLLVRSEHADEARDVLRSQEQSHDADVPRAEPQDVRSHRRFRFPRMVLGFVGFTVACSVALALSVAICVAVADVVHPSSSGHVARLPLPFPYVVGTAAILLTVNRWIQERAVILIPVTMIILAAMSVRTREAPSPPSLPSPSSAPSPGIAGGKGA